MNCHLLNLHVPHPVSLDGTYFNNPHDTLRQIISSLRTLKGRQGTAILTFSRLSSWKWAEPDPNQDSPTLPTSLLPFQALSRRCTSQLPMSLLQRNPCSLIPFLKGRFPLQDLAIQKKKKNTAFIHFLIGFCVKTCWRCHCSRFN